MNEVKIVVKAEDRASATFDKVSKKGSGLGKVLGDVTKIAGGFVLAQGMMKAPAVIMGITSTARDLELQMKKANIVFGDQIGVVEQWAKANAHAMGLTKREATAAAAGFADLLIPMGFTRQEGARMATEVVGLSGALAEWSGGTRTAADVSDILAKAMLGEREGLKGLGISITEAEVKGRLLEKGQEDLTDAALQQAKATATQELIFEKSTDAQAAYAKGAGSAARKQAELTAKFSEAKEAIALKLAPAITNMLSGLMKLVGIIERHVLPAIGRFREWLGPKLSQAWKELQPHLQEFRRYIEEHILPVLVRLGEFIQGVVKVVQQYWPEISRIVKGVFEPLKIYIETWFKVLKGIFDTVMAILEGDWGRAWENIKGILGDVFDGMKALVINRLNLIKDVFTLALKVFKDLFGEKFGELKENVLGIITDLKDKLADHWREIVAVALAVLFAPAAGLWALVTNAFGIRDKMLEAFGHLLTGLGWIWSAIVTTAKNACNAIIGVINGMIGAIEAALNTIAGAINAIPDISIPGWVPGLGGKGFGIPEFPTVNLPRISELQRGTRFVPQDTLALLHRGEMVLPAPAAERVRQGEPGGNRWTNYGYFQIVLPNVRDARALTREIDRQLRGV